MNMFEGIPFTHTETTHALTSKQITEETIRKGKYDPENLLNSEFRIEGATDAFLRPPISDFAKNHLLHMQAFNVFYYKAGSYTRRKNYHSFLLLYTYEGSARLEYGGKKYTLGKSDGALIDCRRPHVYTALTSWDVAVLHFDGPLAGYIHNELAKTGSMVFHEPPTGQLQQMLEELLNIYSSSSLQRDLMASHRIEGLLLHILVVNSNIAMVKRELPRGVQDAMKYMEEHFTEEITLDDLARLTATSKYHLAKEFKKYTSFSPHDYLIRLRINQARILLKTSNLPVVKIALAVGVRDINNFNYLFKSRVGKTPLEYRASPDFIA